MGIGKVDFPVQYMQEDKLSIDMQVNGFSDFIMHCETPLAVAIQGPWGSGKTSFVNLVMDRVKSLYCSEDNSYAYISFNVWQYSQFGLENQLLTSLLTALIREIKKDMPADADKGHTALDEISRGIKFLGKTSLGMVSDVIKKKTNIDVKAYVDSAVKEFTDAGAQKPAPDPIGTLKKNFQIAVNERLAIKDNCDQDPNRRLIIFLDDLDRLSPDRAVEVLEILKIFLDCKHCVFLLAIDYDVVVNGVSIKYKGTLSAQKGKDFFEKMIQVVYCLPSSLHHADRFIASILADSHMNRALAVDFAKLVKASGKDNPRTIKRLVNSFLLLSRMKQYVPAYKDIEEDVALFAMLCLQNTCPELYQYLSLYDQHLPLDVLDYLKSLSFGIEESNPVFSEQHLYRLGLADGQGKKDLLKWEFLRAFFEQIVECDWQSSEELGSFDYEAPLTQIHERILRSALQLTQVAQLENTQITEDDCVAFLIADCEVWPTDEGSIGEAFALSCQYLIGWVKDDLMADIIEEFPFISTNEAQFSSARKITKAAIPFYVDQSLPASTMVCELERLAQYIESADNGQITLVWFKDKAGKKELWSYCSAQPPQDNETLIEFDSDPLAFESEDY